MSVSGGDWEPVPHAAYLLLFVLSQHSHETQRPALVPCPEGHLRDHPEDSAAVPGLSPAACASSWRAAAGKTAQAAHAGVGT